MKKINNARSKYFEGHKDAKELWFVKIGGVDKGYLSEWAANNSIGKAKDATVDHITREEVEEWIANGGETAPATFDHEVTEQDMIENPEFKDQGINVGDIIQVPIDAEDKEPEVVTPEDEKRDVAAAAKKKTAKKKKPAAKKSASKK